MYAFFKHIGSLGDSLIINGLIHRWAQECTQLFYYPNPQHFNTLLKLYEGHDNIVICRSEDTYNSLKQQFTPIREISPWQYISTTLDTEQAYWLNWDRQIYEFYGELYKVRYEGFKLPKNLKTANTLFNNLVEPGERYIVRHQFMNSLTETFSNFNITPFNPENLRVIDITPTLAPCIFDYVTLLQNAEQIHVTPSSIFCLVDSINHLIPGKKYLHLTRKDYASQYNSFLNNFCWTPISYSKKFKS